MKYQQWAISIAVFAVLCVIVFGFIFFFKTTEIGLNYPIDTNVFANFGALIGGVTSASLSLASILLLLQTIKDTNRNVELQLYESKISSTKQQIESRFFELIKIHRENRSEIIVIKPEYEVTFQALVNEYEEIFKCIECANDLRSERLDQSDIINIAFLSFYYGVLDVTPTENYSFQQISRVLHRFRDMEFTKFANDILTLLNMEEQKLRLAGRFKFSLFTGHQPILGHYYRHIYQTVKFIDEQPGEILNYWEKYNYVKILRAQLSTHEQLLFCFNSLSDLGGIWEMDVATQKQRKLITKYNLIKNIPVGIIKSFVDIKKYYPDVNFEIDGAKTKEREKLEELYLKNNN